MRTVKLIGMAVVVLTVATVAAGQGFKVYPGAKKLVSPESKDASASLPGVQIDSYLTDDPFEKVVAFYKSIGKESAVSFLKKSEKLPNGQELTRTWFIFDGAADITTSKSWAMVQRPYVPVDDNGELQYKNARNVTAIVVQQVTQNK